ncbi:hypothetical protein OKA05_21345 [Luteolibacter arcticus]|uniref:Uncharacterized protein n=1 Tax=Luteolibacter arcticus TaxID=1581411 RepID=A0ABT3GNL5_9BACT|nr:hypothetical protein [Luteolibacter arcticus]MCW1925120.1 hypothetical protein [Luteolibacter arcticus]
MGAWNDFRTIGTVDDLPAVDVTDGSPLNAVVVRIPRSNAGVDGKLFGRVVATKQP